MPSFPELLSAFVLLWAVIDPIGTLPVFIAATRDHTPAERRKVARLASLTAGGILIFFLVVGEVLLRAMGVPLLAFQIAGGLKANPRENCTLSARSKTWLFSPWRRPRLPRQAP